MLWCSRRLGLARWKPGLSNLTSPGDEVLVLTAGKFGERWTSLAKAFGCNSEGCVRAVRRDPHAGPGAQSTQVRRRASSTCRRRRPRQERATNSRYGGRQGAKTKW